MSVRKLDEATEEIEEKRSRTSIDVYTERFAYEMDSTKRQYIKEAKNKRIIKKLNLFGGKCIYYTGTDAQDMDFTKQQVPGDIRWAGNLSSTFEERVDLTDSSKQHLFNVISNYVDLAAIVQDKEHRDIYMAHVLNHLIRLRNSILGNQKKLNQAKEKGDIDESVLESCRDQGFVRPTVLILCPFKKDAYDVVQRLKSILYGNKKGLIMNNERFEKEYQSFENEFSEYISEDHKELLSGNNDDSFRLGITISKKAVKIFEPFEKSDILLCSPLGLRMVLEKEKDESHLISSLQIVIVDGAEIILQQNWENMSIIFDKMHIQPSKIVTDISRVKSFYLEQDGKVFSQLLLFSKYQHEYFAGLMFANSLNYRGLIMHQPIQEGTLSNIEIPLCQEFHRFSVDNVSDPSEARFNFFKEKFADCLIPHTCLVVPSYFDFVRIRNFFKRREESFVSCHEYADKKKIKRARDLFYHDMKSILIVTERFHFFNRKNIKGIERLVFYQIPSHPAFYSEFINMGKLAKNRFLSSLIYSKHDRVRLSNTFGTDMTDSILKSENSMQAIVSE